MKKLLHILAASRGELSRTLKVSRAFLEAIKEKYPGCLIEELNLAIEPLPPLNVKIISGKYVLLGGKDLPLELERAWEGILRYIRQFLSADAYLVSAPMWNFSIPYFLKHYLDIIIQPKYLFRYNEKGIEGLVKNKKMLVVTSRGGDYSVQSPYHNYDFQEPYLRAIFGLVGISEINFIHAQPMDMGPNLQMQKIEEAQALAHKAAENF